MLIIEMTGRSCSCVKKYFVIQIFCQVPKTVVRAPLAIIEDKTKFFFSYRQLVGVAQALESEPLEKNS